MRTLYLGTPARHPHIRAATQPLLSAARQARYMMHMPEVLFCPFCGEAFEGETRCPEHELLLLPWTELPRKPRAADAHAALPWYSPRAGRGGVFAGACIALLSFAALPLARVERRSSWAAAC